MSNQDESLSRQDEIHEAIFQALGLRLADSTLANLLEGERVTFAELAGSHSLGELGTMLIRIDTLGRIRNNSRELATNNQCGGHCIPCPFGPCCVCIDLIAPLFELHIPSE
jgi:hypothetical protein